MLYALLSLGVVVLIIILIIYLMHDSDTVKEAKKVPVDISKKLNGKAAVKITGGPTLNVKAPGSRHYEQIPMTKAEFSLGSGEHNDLVLDDDVVDSKHALLIKKLKGNQVYYELVNLSKNNPVEYYNGEKQCFENIAYKHGVILDESELFYIGNTKLIVTCPPKKKYHEISATERVIMNGANNSEKVQNTAKEMADHAFDSEPDEIEVNREPSIRIVSKEDMNFRDEIDI